MMNSGTAGAAAAAASTKLLDLLVIGGGQSGVFVAHDYHHRDSTTSEAKSWKLVEARSTLGGRLANDEAGQDIDLGGAWVWPQHQPNLRHCCHNWASKPLHNPTIRPRRASQAVP